MLHAVAGLGAAFADGGLYTVEPKSLMIPPLLPEFSRNPKTGAGATCRARRLFARVQHLEYLKARRANNDE